MAGSGSAVSSVIGTAGMRSKPWTRSDLLHQVGLALDIGAPGRHVGSGARRPSRVTAKPSAREDALRLGRRQIDAAEALDAVGPQGRGGAARRGMVAGADDVARLAAAELEDQPRRDFGAPVGALRIEAALEAVARIGLDAELAAGGGGARSDRTAPPRGTPRWCLGCSRRPRRP